MKQLFVTVLACAIIAPCVAAAEPGLAGEVYSPTVTRGQSEFELRGGLLDGGEGDGEWQMKAEAAHAFTDWWRPALVAEWEREDSDAAFTAFAIENVFDFTMTRTWPVHFGAYVEYEFAQDGPDAAELKLLMEHTSGPIGVRLNLIGERELGSGADNTWEFGYAAQASYALNEDLTVGVQGFGDSGTDDDFGNLDKQAHYWGPFAEFEVGDIGSGEVEMQLGYLAGFGESEADGQFRVKLEYEFGS